MVFSLKKEGDSDLCHTTDEPLGHDGEYNQAATKGEMMYDSTYVRFLEESNSQTPQVETGYRG